MSETKNGDALSEIRHEYRAKKKHLKKYDGFIDRHQGLLVGLPLLVVVIGIVVTVVAAEQSDSEAMARAVGALSALLFLATLVMAFITGSRKSAKARIEKQLAALKDEAIAFQRHSKDHDNVGRDELDLWRNVERDASINNPGKGGWVMGIIVIVVVAAVISINQANQRNQEAAERARQMQIMEQQRAKQEQDAIEQRKLDQQDEANRLQQQQNAIDLYNSTKTPSSSRSSTHCSTSYYSGSASTYCY